MEETEGSSATTEEAKAQDKLEQPSKPWHSYISEELPRSLMDSRDSAIRSARSLHQNSSTHLSSLQDFMLDMRSKYAVYEDAFFTKVKDGVTIARQHPTLTAGLGLSAAFLLMHGPRRFLFRHTLGRLQSEEARFVKAEKNVNMLSLSVDLMKKESKKLLQRADFAEKEMINGRTELLNAGKNLQTLAKSVDKVEAQAAGRAADTLRLEIRNVILMDCNHKPPISLSLLACTPAPLQCLI
uniref:Uncharacterized protein n=1 Tax=Opuntia streptacantha TaxID=393608 RepID=A0A7C9A6D8_OPUST